MQQVEQKRPLLAWQAGAKRSAPSLALVGAEAKVGDLQLRASPLRVLPLRPD